MSHLKRAFLLLLVLLAVGGGIAFCVLNYSWVFAKHVRGEVVDVERVMNPTAILGRATEAQIHSYAILIQGEDGKLYTASSQDRQWQVVRKGYCVDALLYVYPPWNLQRAGTYFNARLNELKQCPGKPLPPPPAEEGPQPPPASSPLGK